MSDWSCNQTTTIPVSRNAGYGRELSPSGQRLMFVLLRVVGRLSTTFINVAS